MTWEKHILWATAQVWGPPESHALLGLPYCQTSLSIHTSLPLKLFLETIYMGSPAIHKVLKATSLVHGTQAFSLLSESLRQMLIHLTLHLRNFPVSRRVPGHAIVSWIILWLIPLTCWTRLWHSYPASSGPEKAHTQDAQSLWVFLCCRRSKLQYLHPSVEIHSITMSKHFEKCSGAKHTLLLSLIAQSTWPCG